jgi:hypothetical protein
MRNWKLTSGSARRIRRGHRKPGRWAGTHNLATQRHPWEELMGNFRDPPYTEAQACFDFWPTLPLQVSPVVRATRSLGTGQGAVPGGV